MKRFRKISSVLLLVLYATFFASTNLCVHSHDVEGVHIVHSHLGGGSQHSHTASQLQTINYLGCERFVAAEALASVAGPCLLFCEDFESPLREAVITFSGESHSLRAPPFFA